MTTRLVSAPVFIALKNNGMREIIIQKHGGGELANQLWNYASIYAYGLEKNIPVRNPSFFEYHSFFKFLPMESLTTKCFSFFFRSARRRAHFINRIARLKYSLISWVILKLSENCIVTSQNKESNVFYLPPAKDMGELKEVCGKVYFLGWLFRNPVGLEKFRSEIIKNFEPNELTVKKIGDIINPLKERFKNIIGVHIRQADYKIFKGGKYFINQVRVRQILEEYAQENFLNKEEILFVIASDGPIEKEIFSNLNTYISHENAVADLFLLSKTSVIIGSDSSFGGFASYYGNIPLIIMEKEKMDWEYYRDKKKYFENKYSTTILY